HAEQRLVAPVEGVLAGLVALDALHGCLGVAPAGRSPKCHDTAPTCRPRAGRHAHLSALRHLPSFGAGAASLAGRRDTTSGASPGRSSTRRPPVTFISS